MKLTTPITKWRRRNPVEQSSRYVGEHAGYDTTPLPRLTWKGFSMGILVSMGKCNLIHFTSIYTTVS
jgi:SP family sugar:H+ symporter-like MFS transporter